ncbi:patatin-like phospholipase family protein [Rapidithrix thailandica]|uniref:Patatin-like phospholipase family protein n=1 Tax=Rapidithrix thailandica TaxID=413964 RepID=A0AAW9SJI8_9BACT
MGETQCQARRVSDYEHQTETGSYKKYSLGLVLSGGGARCFLQIGVLKALEEHNLQAQAVAGSNLGALIGALYAAGLSASEMLEKLNGIFPKKIRSSEIVQPFGVPGQVLRSVLSENDFQVLKKKLYVGVTCLESQSAEILQKGKLFEAVSASCSFPLLYTPVVLRGKHYLDGSLLNAFPIQPLEHSCKMVIGINVNHSSEKLVQHSFQSLYSKIFSMTPGQQVQNALHKCKYLIDPYLSSPCSLLDFSQADRLYEQGYREGVKLIEENPEILHK